MTNSETETVKNSNDDNTKIQTVTNSKNHFSTKFYISKCEYIQNLKLWQNSRTQNVTKLKSPNFD